MKDELHHGDAKMNAKAKAIAGAKGSRKVGQEIYRKPPKVGQEIRRKM
jgi:hypothetical protein